MAYLVVRYLVEFGRKNTPRTKYTPRPDQSSPKLDPCPGVSGRGAASRSFARDEVGEISKAPLYVLVLRISLVGLALLSPLFLLVCLLHVPRHCDTLACLNLSVLKQAAVNEKNKTLLPFLRS